jgi:hypothetical protein
MYTHYLHHFQAPTPFPHLPSPTGTKPPPGRTCSTFLLSDFVNEKSYLFSCLI